MKPIDANKPDGVTNVVLSPSRPKIGFNYAWAFNKYGLYFGPHVPNPTLPLPAPTLPTNDADLAAAALIALPNALAEGLTEDVRRARLPALQRDQLGQC